MWVVSNKYNYLFVHVPKNAGNSLWQSLLERERFGKILLLQKKMHMRLSNGGRNKTIEKIILSPNKLNKELDLFAKTLSSTHARIEDISKIIDKGRLNKLFKFGVVRNPWDRAVSLYRYHQYDPNIRKMSFYDYLLNKGEMGMLSQMNWFERDGVNVMDAILKQEDLAEELPEFMKKLGIKDFNLSHKNASNRDSDYRKYFKDKELELVNKYSQKEINRFNYEFM
jgi:hypothetical protein